MKSSVGGKGSEQKIIEDFPVANSFSSERVRHSEKLIGGIETGYNSPPAATVNGFVQNKRITGKTNPGITRNFISLSSLSSLFELTRNT